MDVGIHYLQYPHNLYPKNGDTERRGHDRIPMDAGSWRLLI
jgi:hypothetical protein